ncbi:alpha/beta fold hydrolase [Streptomyces krungchingensis]|uniref:alpha/beta fold hydrolase n=1 Tax=Streptomyces krungchingensis TaxID=1565034 RepID=UPI003CF09EF0
MIKVGVDPWESRVAWAERTVTRDRVRRVCRDWGGPGTPVVLLHGLAGHSGEWDAVARHLSRRYRVVAVDQRGTAAAACQPLLDGTAAGGSA